MTQRFNLAQGWQLFLLFFAFPFVLMAVFIMSTMSRMVKMASLSLNPQSAINSFYDFYSSTFSWLFAIIVLASVPLFLWHWSMGVGLQRKLPSSVKMNVPLFKGFMIYFYSFQIIYMIVIWSLFKTMFNMPFSTIGNPVPDFSIFFRMMGTMLVMLPLGLFALFCNIYNIRFCAKTLKSVELGRQAHFGDYIGDFFLILFAPIGVWFIQPRVNQFTLELPDNADFKATPKPTGPKTPYIKKSMEDIEEDPLPETKSKGNPFEHDDDFDGLF